MSSFQVFLCVAIGISPIWTLIPYDDIKVNIFDREPRNFELHVSTSTSKLIDFFARHDVLLAATAGVAVLELVPYIGQFTMLLPMMLDAIIDESDWRKAFSKATKDETMREVGESEIRWMFATMQTIQSKIKLLNDDNSDDENRKIIASIIHTELNRIINVFALKSSLLRKYPLIGAPLLIQLASLVAIFSPIVMKLNPFEAMNPQISCKMHDVLHDYRTRTVMARLHKLRSVVWFVETSRKRDKASLINVISLPYNRHGYNSTNPPIVHCDKGCDLYELESSDACVMDAFEAGIYSGQNFGTHTCLEDYAALLRHRTEKLFPVELLSSLCVDRKPRMATGKLKTFDRNC